MEGSDEDDPGRTHESAGVEARVKVDAVLEKSTPSVSRRKVSKSVVSQKRSSSVEDDRTGREMAFEKPCGSDATSSVEEDNATVPGVGCFGVLGSDMLSHSRSTSASSSSHALGDQKRNVSHERLHEMIPAYLCVAEASVTPAICRSRTKNVGNGNAASFCFTYNECVEKCCDFQRCQILDNPDCAVAGSVQSSMSSKRSCRLMVSFVSTQ